MSARGDYARLGAVYEQGKAAEREAIVQYLLESYNGSADREAQHIHAGGHWGFLASWPDGGFDPHGPKYFETAHSHPIPEQRSAAQEREAVVGWLRSKADDWWAADAIENGEHVKNPPEQDAPCTCGPVEQGQWLQVSVADACAQVADGNIFKCRCGALVNLGENDVPRE